MNVRIPFYSIVVVVTSFGPSVNESDRVLLAVGWMSACLGGVVQAPVTAVLIILK